MSSPGPRTTRRHRTQQRTQLLAWLRACNMHPTATELYEALREQFPRISLGTVYRNLEVLVAEGEIETVPCESGALRYEGNPQPHHHFTCERCGDIQDIELPAPRTLGRKLRERYALQARKIRIDFAGLCSRCEEPQSRSTQHKRSTKAWHR